MERRVKQSSPTGGCPHCSKRGRMIEYAGAVAVDETYTVFCWQCLYCGCIVEKIMGKWRVMARKPIVLAPGELV